jgi:hypothetical protein
VKNVGNYSWFEKCEQVKNVHVVQKKSHYSRKERIPYLTLLKTGSLFDREKVCLPYLTLFLISFLI